MGRKRWNKPKYRPVSKAGWFWRGFPVGAFCPDCGAALYSRRGIHPYLFCVECGWEEPNPSLEDLLGREKALQVRMRQLGFIARG